MPAVRPNAIVLRLKSCACSRTARDSGRGIVRSHSPEIYFSAVVFGYPAFRSFSVKLAGTPPTPPYFYTFVIMGLQGHTAFKRTYMDIYRSRKELAETSVLFVGSGAKKRPSLCQVWERPISLDLSPIRGWVKGLYWSSIHGFWCVGRNLACSASEICLEKAAGAVGFDSPVSTHP
jgi:hypothetical protein